MLSQAVQQKIFAKLLSKPENSRCADCNSKSPSWASIDFGVFVCINCSGAHRALGPSVTRVKSTKLDTWHSEWTDLLVLGNDLCNNYWEHNLNNFRKPNTNSSLDEIKKYVNDKYVKRKYAAQNQVDPVSAIKFPKKEVEKSKPQNQSTEYSKFFENSKPKVALTHKDNGNFSIQTNPDADLLTFEQLPSLNKPEKKIQKQLPKPEINLMSFDEPKKSHSIDYIHHKQPQIQTHHSKNLYQVPHHNNFNQYPQYAQYHHQFNNFNNMNMAQFQTMSHYPNYNRGYNQNFAQPTYDYKPQQPVLNMNINMNMYANNLNINMVPQKKEEKIQEKKKDLLSSFDEFKF